MGWASPSAHCSQLPVKAGRWNTGHGIPLGIGPEAGDAWPGSEGADRPVPGRPRRPSGCSRASRSSRLVSCSWSVSCLICLARSRSNLSILRTGSASFSACSVSSRVRRPSMASSTCSAITGPTLPRSSRIASTLRTARIRNSRSASRSPTAVSTIRRLPLLVALADEVVDPHRLRLLAVAVDAAVPLLQPVGVPRDLVVDQAVAVVLEVDALRRRHRWPAGCGRGFAWDRSGMRP